jgi:hypothetical protein
MMGNPDTLELARMKTSQYGSWAHRRIARTATFIALAVMLCQSAASRPPSVTPEGHEVALAMHWLTAVVPPPPSPPPPPQFPAPPVTTPPPSVTLPCPAGNADCVAPTPAPTIDQRYRDGFVPSGVAALLAAELPRLIHLLPANSAAKVNGWSVSISNCSTTAPYILVCKDLTARVIRIAPILVAAIFGKDPHALVEVQQKLQSFGADPGSFDGSYQSVYAAHGLDETDWNAVLKSYAGMVWSPLVSSVDFVIAQQMASLYLSPDSPLPATDPRVNQEAKALSTAPDWFYDPSGLVLALQQAAGKYDSRTWGYERAGDVGDVLGAIPPGGR